MAMIARREVLLMLGVLIILFIGTQPPLSADDAPPQGEIAFVSDRDGNNEIYVANVDGSSQRNLTQNIANDYSPIWSPDASKIAFTSMRDGNNEIYVMDSDGQNVRNLTNNPANDLLLAWSPDGKFIAYQSSLEEGNDENGDGLFIMNPDDSNRKQISTVHYGIAYPLSWSPDSKSILFFAEQYGVGANGQRAWETVLVDLEASKSFAFDWYSRNLSWSPDGKEIMFGDCAILTKTGLNGETNSFDLGQEYEFSDKDAVCAVPYGWSPDGNRILFSIYFRGYDKANQAGLYFMNADGRQVHQLTHENIAYDAKWSPDGKHVVYVSECQIYVVDVETSSMTALTDAPGHNEYPVWRP